MRLLALFVGLVAAPVAALDYARPESWLCRPDANGPCDTDLSLTDISPAGMRQAGSAKGFARNDSARPGWGLHLVDMNIALGDLLELARRQTAAWLGKQQSAR